MDEHRSLAEHSEKHRINLRTAAYQMPDSLSETQDTPGSRSAARACRAWSSDVSTPAFQANGHTMVFARLDRRPRNDRHR